MSYTPHEFRVLFIDLYGAPDIGDSIRTQAQSSRIDQKFTYLDERFWFAVADDPIYGHHDVCLQTLDALLQATEWKSSACKIGTLVDLGVGTGEKVARVASALLEVEDGSGLTVILLDMSEPMLGYATERLKSLSSGARPLTVVAAHADFEALPALMRHPSVRGSHSQAGLARAFLLLGNTVANLDEDKTLRMLSFLSGLRIPLRLAARGARRSLRH